MTINPASFQAHFDEEHSVLTLTLNRPERLNALTFEVYTELRDTFRALNDPATSPARAVVLTGNGRGFCSGGDVEDIIGALFERDYQGLLAFTRLTCDLILSIRQCRLPVVAALNGTVAGAGAVIACACDIRVASPQAKIAFLFTKVGLAGADMGAAWLLPRIVGNGVASELLMTGDFISPERAHQINLYNHVVPSEALMEKATGLAQKLGRGPSFALEMTKDLLNREASMDLVSALEVEAQAQAVCMQHPNFRESYVAFIQKRKPRFT